MKKITIVTLTLLLAFYNTYSQKQEEVIKSDSIKKDSILSRIRIPDDLVLTGSEWNYGTNTAYYTEGHVGIGISNPTYRLHVVAPANTWKARFSGTDGYIDIGPANSTWAHIYTDRPNFIFNKPIYSIEGKFSSYSTTNLYLQTNGTNRITILDSNGNVGIGTTSPSSPLTVNGNIYSNSLAIDNHQSVDWTYAFYLKVDRDLTKAFAICDKNSNEVFRIYGNGIVYSKKIIAEEFEVRPDAGSIHWYDHVFKQDYKLKSIYEVEQYIKENNHLPDISSEKDVKENGYNMVEMDGLLLKKIEELTLYIIQQQKEIETLKQKIINDK